MVRDAYGNAAAAEDDDGGDDARASAPTPSLSEASRSALSLQLAAATSKCGWYLSSCVAYVACDGERRAELCRLLRAGGATRMDTLRNGVTHVLLGPHGLPPREAEVVRAIEPAPVLCRRQWLLECTRARAHLPAPRNLTLSAVTTVGAPHRGAGAGSSGNTDGRASRSGRDSKRESKRAKVSGPFEGLRFAALTAGLPDHSKALQRIAELGGEVMLECAPGEADESVVEQLRKMHYVLCPEALPGLRKLLAGRRIPVVTMPWVQACRRAKRVVDSTESVSYEPLPFAVPLPAMQGTVEGAGAGAGAGSGSSEGGDGVRVCVTQYAGAVRREIMYVARLLGAQYLPDCDARCTHLVAMRPDALTDDTKFGYAVARGIPVVRCEWLWEAARTGTVPDTAEFAVRPTRAGQAAGDTPMPASTEGHSDSRGGGSEAEQRAEAEAEAEAEEDEEEAELVDPAIVELQKQARKVSCCCCCCDGCDVLCVARVGAVGEGFSCLITRNALSPLSYVAGLTALLVPVLGRRTGPASRRAACALGAGATPVLDTRCGEPFARSGFRQGRRGRLWRGHALLVCSAHGRSGCRCSGRRGRR